MKIFSIQREDLWIWEAFELIAAQLRRSGSSDARFEHDWEELRKRIEERTVERMGDAD